MWKMDMIYVLHELARRLYIGQCVSCEGVRVIGQARGRRRHLPVVYLPGLQTDPRRQGRGYLLLLKSPVHRHLL